MSILYERISTLCKQHNISNSKLCLLVGIQPSIMSDLKTGRKKSLSAETADKIASYFGVSVGYLLGTEQKEKPAPDNRDRLSDKDVRFIKWFRSLPPETQKAILVLGDAPKDLSE